MNQAIAAVGSTRPTTTPEATTPVVFVNGTPDPDLAVVSLRLEGPLDTRRATLHLAKRLADDRAAPPGAEVTIAVPHALSDGASRWQVLLSGRASDRAGDQLSGAERDAWVVPDRLAALLDEPLQRLLPRPAEDLLLGPVLDRIASWLGAETVFACDAHLLAERIDATSPQTRSIASLLGPVLSDLGLAVGQSLTLEGARVRRTLTVLPARSGRRVVLPWPDDEGRGGSVLSVTAGRQARPPRVWVARGGRPVVEDTFTLQPGWDPSLQGRPDSDYARLTSSDFGLYGPVYRAWVLNEDGAYNGAPFNLGQAFDAGALFDQPGTLRSPLRFGACLARDSAGRRLPPIIESSTDSGAAWSACPGRVEVMRDRAGVLLNDDELPSAVLSAAKAGTLRLRVTASLTSPDAIEARRWDGNPFAGPAPTRTVDLGGRYAWRAVAATSIHRDAVEAGTLSADTTDDRRALRAKLQAMIAQQPGPAVSARLGLAGAWTALRPGDRVGAALGRGVALDGSPAGFATRDARIQQIDLAFGVFNHAPRTTLRLD
ncbi:MAG: hypothetical protein AAGI37_03050 [Planctomycetota bacterium]